MQTVSSYFSQHRTRSLRRAVQDLGIPSSTAHIILKKMVNMVLYKITRVYQLQPQDDAERVTFLQSYLDNTLSDSGYLSQIVFSAEYVFHDSPFVNTQNIHTWSTETQKRFYNVILQKKIIFWCAVHRNGGPGPYYFNIEQSEESIFSKFCTTTYYPKHKKSHKCCFPAG